MWAIRRASIVLRNRGLIVRASRVKLTRSSCADEERGISEFPGIRNREFLSQKINYSSGNASLKFTESRRELSSSSTKAENDLEDAFSELDTPAGDGKDNEDLLTSESDLSDGSDSEDVEHPHNETGEPTKAKKLRYGKAESELVKEVLNVPGTLVHSALEKWVGEGKELRRQEISLVMNNLRARRMFGRALQLSEWLESKRKLEFIERDYACRVDLIAKVHGLQKAEAYIQTIPESFRTEIIYRTLLANCVVHNNVNKAEQIFSKMKDLGFPVTVFACNQLLLLYKRIDRRRIADVLLLMENENIKPSPFTYEILIDTKGRSKDIAGMDKIIDRMKAEGIEPDINTLAVVVRHYISAGLQDKAGALLKEMEGENLKQNRLICRTLLPLYADLGKVDEVERIWKCCETNPPFGNCLAAIEAWGKLNKIDKAEEVFDVMSKKWRLSSKNCSALLKVYARNKMLMKGKDLVKRMADNGCSIGPLAWDAIVKLYVESGEVEKADSILQKAAQQNLLKPIFSTFITVMAQYAKRGDVHNSEKIFLRMQKAEYRPQPKMYEHLMQAYINAKIPAYGMRDRMRADNIIPTKFLMKQLALIDGFRKNSASDLLD